MRGRWLAVLALIAGAAGLAGCETGPTAPSNWADPTAIEYYPGLHVDLARMTKTASGAFYWDSIPGTGTVAAKQGDEVTVHYTLWLPDGTLIDNYNGQSFTTQLNPDSVIVGWVDGLSGAVQGTTRQLVIPPALGYGPYGAGQIPPNTTLIFLVTVDRVTPAPTDTTAASSDVAAASGSLAAASGDVAAAGGDVAAGSGDVTAASGDVAARDRIAVALVKSGAALRFR